MISIGLMASDWPGFRVGLAARTRVWDMCTMRRPWLSADGGAMTDAKTFAPSTTLTPPLSRVTQLAVALSLILGAALVAIPQYFEYLRAGDLEREEQIAWGLTHQSFYRAEWAAGMVGSFLLLLGFLGLWQLTRWHTPKLTLIGAVVLTWGMAGQIFSDVATYTAQVVAADVFGASGAERLIADGYLKDPGMIAVVLVPVIAGMFFGVLMLAAACWRSGLPKAPVVALALWPLWDFFGPGPVGPFSGELLLLFAGVWLGVAVNRLSRQRWVKNID